MTRLVIILWLASFGLDWPGLPGNARLAELLIIPAAIAILSARGRWLRPNVLDAAVMAYLAAGAFSVLASSDRVASLYELARHAYLAAIYFVVALAVRRGFGSSARVGLATMGAAPAIPSLLVAALFLFQRLDVPMVGEVMTLPYAGDVLRLRGFTASPTMFACLLTMALPFAIAGWVQSSEQQGRRVWAAATLVMALALVMTFSHVWAGAAMAVTVALWPLIGERANLRAVTVAAVVALTIVFNASLVASVRSVSKGDSSVTDSTAYAYEVGTGSVRVAGYTVDYALMSYGRVKQLAWEAFLNRPLTGIGLDRFHEVTTAAYQQGRLTHMYREIDPHSSLLGRLAETGVLGGLTLVALWAAFVATGLRLSKMSQPYSWEARAAFAGLAGLLLAGINVDIMNFRFVWAAFGVLRGMVEISPGTHSA